MLAALFPVGCDGVEGCTSEESGLHVGLWDGYRGWGGLKVHCLTSSPYTSELALCQAAPCCSFNSSKPDSLQRVMAAPTEKKLAPPQPSLRNLTFLYCLKADLPWEWKLIQHHLRASDVPRIFTQSSPMTADMFCSLSS